MKSIEQIAVKVANTINEPFITANDSLVKFATKFLEQWLAQQTPVSYQYQDRNGQWKDFLDQRHYENTVADGTWPIRALYTTPPTSPEGWQPIETAPKNQAVFVKLISSDIPYAARFDGECWELTWDGYCLSEFDGPTHWKPLPPPPGEKK